MVFHAITSRRGRGAVLIAGMASRAPHKHAYGSAAAVDLKFWREVLEFIEDRGT